MYKERQENGAVDEMEKVSVVVVEGRKAVAIHSTHNGAADGFRGHSARPFNCRLRALSAVE